MTMHLGKDSAYSVFAAAQMAREQSAVSAEDLVESCGIPADSLSVILPKLLAAEIIRREAGPPERFALAKPAGEITLRQIVEATEGKEEPDLLLPRHAGSPDAASADRVPALQPVASLAAALLGSRTLQDMVDATGGPTGQRRDDAGGDAPPP